MAGRMVAAGGWRVRPSALALSLLLTGVCACSSFDPVQETRFKLLHAGEDTDLGISGAHWLAYDDQHSQTSACTNGAAGNHAPNECSLLYQPAFSWDNPKCPKHGDDLKQALAQGDIDAPETNASVCIQGVLRPLLPCVSPTMRCKDTTNGALNVDQSNMWGAGVGLALSANGKQPWNAREHGVRGVAFDLSGVAENELGGTGLNLRVEIPIVLAPDATIPTDTPVMRNDGTLIGNNGRVYSYLCDSGTVLESPFPEEQEPGQLRDVLVSADGGPESGDVIVTSELHPSGSPFWQPGPMPAWVPSPLKVGHNEFEWGSVLPPKDSEYKFHETQILGIHFQVVHADPSNTEDLHFAFCIKNLAFLFE